MKKYLALLCALMTFTTFGSCGNNGDTSGGVSEISESSISEIETISKMETVSEFKTTITESTTQEISTESKETTTIAETVTEENTSFATEEATEQITEDVSENNIDINNVEDVAIEENEEMVTIVLPSNFINDPDTTIANAQNNSRIISCTLNENGSATYVISQKEYANFLNELSASCDESLNQILANGNYPSIVNIEHNSDFTDISITVTDEESFSKSLDNFAIIGVLMLAKSYQIFDNKEQISGTVHYIDLNGNEFRTTYFPE